MSFHVDISEEAQKELKSARRKNILSSIIVTVLSVILLAILFISLKIVIADKKIGIIVYPYEGQIVEPPPPTPLSPETEKSSSSEPPQKITRSNETGDIFLPPVNTPTEGPLIPHKPIFDFDGPGKSEGPSTSNPPRPPFFAPRCGKQDRLARIKQYGGDESYEESVLKSLRWMMKNQNADGSWGSTNKTAMTGLVLLAYMAHCETPFSEEFGESCLKAITYLIDVGKKNNGILSDTPGDKYISYQHAIATYALAEAHTMCQSFELTLKGLREMVAQSGAIIVRSQATDGSWMYFYRTREGNNAYPDLSITGWNIQALKAITYTGIDLPVARSLMKAENFVKKMCNSRTGEFQYKAGDFRLSMVPVGVLSLQMIGKPELRETRTGLDYMAKNIKPEFQDPYTYYYAAQAFINRGGEVWKHFGKKMGDTIVSRQKDDGSWPEGSSSLIASHTTAREKEIYITCLNALTLEVYYRFLPGTGEGAKNL